MADEQKSKDQPSTDPDIRRVEDAVAHQTTTGEYDQLAEQADQERTKKPGSQSNSSDQHNNGRGGGK